MPVSPASASITIWTENVEKVVKPPRKPTPIPSRTSLENQPDGDEQAEQERADDVDRTVDQSSPW